MYPAFFKCVKKLVGGTLTRKDSVVLFLGDTGITRNDSTEGIVGGVALDGHLVFHVEGILAAERVAINQGLEVAVDVADGVVQAVFGEDFEYHVGFTLPVTDEVRLFLAAGEEHDGQKKKSENKDFLFHGL